MCDIFPEVSTCCFLISLRIGMLLISVLAIMTGVIGLSAMEQRSNINYENARVIAEIRKPQDALNKMSTLVSSGISAMSCIFMLTGLVLLFGTLTDNEGLVQIFVWVTFLNVIIGFFMVLGTAYECLTNGTCLLAGMDWLSGSALLVLVVAYLFLWIYYISVANSYVIGVTQ